MAATMTRRQLRRIQPRRTRPQQRERAPSEVNNIEPLAATIKRPAAELALATSPSQHRGPSLLPISACVKPRQLVLV